MKMKYKSGGSKSGYNAKAKASIAKKPVSGKNPNTNFLTPTPCTIKETKVSTGGMGVGQKFTK